MTTEEKTGSAMVAPSRVVIGPGKVRSVPSGGAHSASGRFEIIGQSADPAELVTAVIELGRRTEPA
jgi:hypothetical protein